MHLQKQSIKILSYMRAWTRYRLNACPFILQAVSCYYRLWKYALFTHRRLYMYTALIAVWLCHAAGTFSCSCVLLTPNRLMLLVTLKDSIYIQCTCTYTCVNLCYMYSTLYISTCICTRHIATRNTISFQPSVCWQHYTFVTTHAGKYIYICLGPNDNFHRTLFLNSLDGFH